MSGEESSKTQQRRPKEGDPSEVPLAERDDFEQPPGRAEKPVPQDKPLKDQGDKLGG